MIRRCCESYRGVTEQAVQYPPPLSVEFSWRGYLNVRPRNARWWKVIIMQFKGNCIRVPSGEWRKYHLLTRLCRCKYYYPVSTYICTYPPCSVSTNHLYPGQVTKPYKPHLLAPQWLTLAELVGGHTVNLPHLKNLQVCRVSHSFREITSDISLFCNYP